MRRENNFDILRLIFAWMVVLNHGVGLADARPLFFLYPLLQSRAAVEGFFAISGCLIVASWDRSTSAKDYFIRRAKRILPAYWFAIAFCLVLGSIITTLPLAAFWRSSETWKYIAANISFLNFLHPNLPGVFTTNPVNRTMDGALWTLKVEVSFYLVVPLLVWLVRKIGRAWALSGVFLLSVLYRIGLTQTGHNTLSEQLPGQLAFFVVGAAVYYYYDEFERASAWMWALVAVLFVALFLTNSIAVEALAVPVLVLSIAFLLPVYRGITKYGDFSYGTYVLHFPVIQTLVAWHLFDRSPWLAMLLVIVSVAALAAVSWFAVERKFLRPARVKQQEREERMTEPVN